MHLEIRNESGANKRSQVESGTGQAFLIWPSDMTEPLGCGTMDHRKTAWSRIDDQGIKGQIDCLATQIGLDYPYTRSPPQPSETRIFDQRGLTQRRPLFTSPLVKSP